MAERLASAITSMILAIAAIIAIAMAYFAFDHCGWQYGLVGGIFWAAVLWPLTIIVAAIAAPLGYTRGRLTLKVEAVILALALGVVGATELIPNFSQPNLPQCQMDL